MAALKFFLSLLLYPLTLLIASAGILAFLAVWTDPAESGLITWAGLVMPAILLANLCAAIYWIFRKSGWASVPLAVILLNSGYLTSIFQISSPVPVSPHDTTVIRIASYNVGGFRSWEKQDTYYPIAAYFREQQVNIACFQEYSEKTKLKADSLSKLLGLPYHAVEYLPGSTANGSAIYSKFPILSHGRLPFASKSNDAMWADIRINGQTIRVVSCHLETTNFYSKRKALKKKEFDNSDPQQLYSVYNDISATLLQSSRIRASQADIVREMADTTSLPLIICGDFNDPPSSYTYRQVKGELKDSFRSKGKGYGYTFRGLHRLLRIDYVLYSPAFECLDYRSEDLSWSDHKPIICLLRL